MSSPRKAKRFAGAEILLVTFARFRSNARMRIVLSFFCGVLVFANNSLAKEPPAPVPSISPYTPIAFLVGGTWRGQLPAGPDGAKKEIELKADWTVNHQGIRFDGTFVAGDKRTPYTSGMYAWNPVKRQLVFLYSDNEGSFTDGAVTYDNGVLIHDFNVAEANGTTNKVQARITPQGPDVYLDDIYLWQDNKWNKFVSVRYERVKS